MCVSHLLFLQSEELSKTGDEPCEWSRQLEFPLRRDLLSQLLKLNVNMWSSGVKQLPGTWERRRPHSICFWSNEDGWMWSHVTEPRSTAPQKWLVEWAGLVWPVGGRDSPYGKPEETRIVVTFLWGSFCFVQNLVNERFFIKLSSRRIIILNQIQNVEDPKTQTVNNLTEFIKETNFPSLCLFGTKQWIKIKQFNDQCTESFRVLTVWTTQSKKWLTFHFTRIAQLNATDRILQNLSESVRGEKHGSAEDLWSCRAAFV